MYFVEGEKVIPKHILMDGNGHIDKAPYLSRSFIARRPSPVAHHVY